MEPLGVMITSPFWVRNVVNRKVTSYTVQMNPAGMPGMLMLITSP